MVESPVSPCASCVVWSFPVSMHGSCMHHQVTSVSSAATAIGWPLSRNRGACAALSVFWSRLLASLVLWKGHHDLCILVSVSVSSYGL
jgi:hypothetical protein